MGRETVTIPSAVREILVATSNAGKLRDLNTLAVNFGVRILAVPGISELPAAREDAPTFEANACKKAEHYSRFVPEQYVLADDSGLEVEALGGAPGVHSARYAHIASNHDGNSTDADNNARLLAELQDVPDDRRKAKFVCCLAVARGGRTVVCFRGELHGIILHEPRGKGGFGYDPLFYLAAQQRTVGELTLMEKAEVSHRGVAFRKFLCWYSGLAAASSATTAPAANSDAGGITRP